MVTQVLELKFTCNLFCLGETKKKIFKGPLNINKIALKENGTIQATDNLIGFTQKPYLKGVITEREK